jgi:fermentation-respiration switch protein FrsA (DUF1100 family)
MPRVGIVLCRFCGAALAIYVALVGGLYALQRDLLYLPDTSRPDAAQVGLPALREVTIRTADGLRLLAWYVPAATGGAVIAYFHGNSGHIGNRAERLRRLAEQHGILMLEYRGFGGNPGSPTEEGLLIDAWAAIDFLVSEGVDLDRIVLYGESLGTSIAVRIASRRRVAALVLESPFTSIAPLARQRYPFVPVDLLLTDRFESLPFIGAVKAPILILQGARDTIVPIESGRRVFAAAQQPKELWVAPDGGHNDLATFGALDATIDFIRRRALKH